MDELYRKGKLALLCYDTLLHSLKFWSFSPVRGPFQTRKAWSSESNEEGAMLDVCRCGVQ